MSSRAPSSQGIISATNPSKRFPGRGVLKQPLLDAERLRRLFTSLCAQIDGGHFNNALKTCDKILRIDPNDVDALKTKLFLLLQTEQYDAALALIKSDEDKTHYAFERAYTLYRLQQEKEAKEILEMMKETEGSDRRVLHLEAQLSYREGSYDIAFELYNQLLDTAEPESEEHSDILTNLQASQLNLDFINIGFLHALDVLPPSLTTAIESSPPPTQPNVPIIGAALSYSATASGYREPAKPQIKKVRKSRVPPGVIPGVTPPPDPERWLKKSERSTFGQGKRRKGPGGSGATQGSANVENTLSGGVGNSSSHSTKNIGGKGKKKK